jgi:hypothetical protein
MAGVATRDALTVAPARLTKVAAADEIMMANILLDDGASICCSVVRSAFTSQRKILRVPTCWAVLDGGFRVFQMLDSGVPGNYEIR